jgi:outer membrane protein assembly factor BamB
VRLFSSILAFLCFSVPVADLAAKPAVVGWQKEIGFQRLVRSDEGAVYVSAANGFIYALRADDGEKLWRYRLGKTQAGPPVITDDSVTAVDQDDRLVSLARENGKENWSYQAPEAVTAGPVISGGLCYFALKDGSVMAVSRWDGKLKWSFKTEAKVVAAPLVSGSDLFIASKDKHLYALDARKGELRWKFKSEGIITASPAADKARVYISSWDGTLYAVDRKSGLAAASVRLKEYCESLPLLLHEDKLYLYTIENRLVVLAADSLAKVASLPIKNLAVAPVIRGGELFIFTDDVTIYDAVTLERQNGYNQVSDGEAKAAVKKYKLDARGEFSPEDEERIRGLFPRIGSQITATNFGEDWLLVAAARGEIYMIALPGLTWRWRDKLGAGLTTDIVARGETIFVGDAAGYLRALDSFGGTLKWQQDLSSPLLSLVKGGEMLFAATADQRLYAIDAAAARVRWYFRSGGKIVGRPSYHSQGVVFGSDDGKLYLIDIAKGDAKYPPSQISGPALTSPLMIGDDVIIGAKGVGIVCQSIAADGLKAKWLYECRDLVADGLVGDEEVTVAATSSGELVLLNSSDGSLIWRRKPPKQVVSPLLLLEGKVAFADDEFLRLYNLVGGEELWSVPLASSLVAGPMANGTAVRVLLADGRLVDYDLSGKQLASRELRSGRTSGMLFLDGTLFQALAEGQLVTYEMD